MLFTKNRSLPRNPPKTIEKHGPLAFINVVSKLPIKYLLIFSSFVPVELESPRDDEHPAQVAETVFRDLVCRASYGNIKAVLKPVLV